MSAPEGERRAYTSARGLARLRTQLSERDMAIVRQIAELRLMSAVHIQAAHFPVVAHGNVAAATRARQRVLARLVRDRLLVSLERRIGGVRAGSAGLVFAVGPVGQRALRRGGRRPRPYEPTWRFVDHTLAISQLVVDLIGASSEGLLDLLDWQVEPACWREYGGLQGHRVLRPDVYVVIGSGDYELRWFVELDRATESLPVIRQKCRRYLDYYQAGLEQARGGVYPRVCWLVPDAKRKVAIERLVARDRELPDGMFAVAETADALAVLKERDV